ncbi:MAG: monovalent cation:proton antiporter-2 (CPA2) family protein [Acidobacteriota bacterium]
MHGEAVFFQAFIYLLAAVISVPISKRLGFGSVLGYLVAGVAIGPFCLRLVGDEGQDVLHFAEFGVVMMLFVVGLELQPSLLWRMRGPILGLGGLQVGVTAAVVTGIGLGLGLEWRPALAIGLILALSSTAIVLQTLDEKGLLKTEAGQSSFSVLLFQDIAVIPIIALLPLLASGHGASGDGHGAHGGHDAGHGPSFVEQLPGWGHALVVLGAIALVILAGRYLVRPLFRIVAGTQLREVFTCAALLLVIGIALLMTKVGLSPALGTFLAGVMLASSEYRHELEAEIEPFKGLMLGLFFISVGASIDFALIAEKPGLIAALTVVLVVVKLLVLFVLSRRFGMGLDQGLLFSFALAQSGEFCFVLFSHAAQHGVLEAGVSSPLVAVVALSMALTPLLMLLNERVIQPRFGTKEVVEREADDMHERNPVIIAGFGRFGHVVGRLLSANGVRCTVLDTDSDQVDLLRRLGLEVYYGDASRADLLHAAGADEAELLIVAVDSVEKTSAIVECAQHHFPNLRILARAEGRLHAYELLDAGVEHVYRETLDTSLTLGVDALKLLGFSAHQVQRSARAFRRHDEASLRELAGLRHDRQSYICRARERIRLVEEQLRQDFEGSDRREDRAWDVSSLSRDEGLGAAPTKT